ncbi:hypothetical protein SAMN05421755_101542 [Nitrosomonas sp. Nm33]|nr:hypothetical protein SAMN05421755_101542 [Nitrosomonas sp. Nm33]
MKKTIMAYHYGMPASLIYLVRDGKSFAKKVRNLVVHYKTSYGQTLLGSLFY